MMIKTRLCTLTAFAAVVFSLAAYSQVGGGETDGRTGTPGTGAVCTHTGADDIPQLSATSGVYLCGAGIKLTIAYAGGHATVVTTPGCPSSITTIPPHGKKVQRLHFNAVLQGVNEGYEQDYRCTGALFWKKCLPTGPKKPNSVERKDFQKEGCDFLG